MVNPSVTLPHGSLAQPQISTTTRHTSGRIAGRFGGMRRPSQGRFQLAGHRLARVTQPRRRRGWLPRLNSADLLRGACFSVRSHSELYDLELAEVIFATILALVACLFAYTSLRDPVRKVITRYELEHRAVFDWFSTSRWIRPWLHRSRLSS